MIAIHIKNIGDAFLNPFQAPPLVQKHMNFVRFGTLQSLILIYSFEPQEIEVKRVVIYRFLISGVKIYTLIVSIDS